MINLGIEVLPDPPGYGRNLTFFQYDMRRPSLQGQRGPPPGGLTTCWPLPNRLG